MQKLITKNMNIMEQKKSKDYNAKDAIKELKGMDVEAIPGFIEGDERASVNKAAEEIIGKDEEVVEVKKATPGVNPKLADPESILKKYDELIDELAKVEASQRMKKKPFRIYFIHRKRMEVMRINFIKSMR